MFGANRDGQGQQYSSPIVTCHESYWNYCIIHYCNVWTIATFAESAVLQHNACRFDFMQSQQYNYCSRYNLSCYNGGY